MKKKLNVIPFISKGKPKETIKEQGEILDHGKIGDLNYEVYARGCIHIFDNNLRFKKDCDIFEDELTELDINSFDDEEETVIEGSGENDNLIFKKKDGDIQLILRKKEFNVINKLKGILKKGKRKKAV